MILDARNELTALDRRVTIAIVGAGAAGLTLARELADVADVLVIESGGINTDEAVNALQKGEVVGLDYPLETTRERRFGGSTYLWAGYCALFDEHDFAQRPWVPNSGWPIQFDEIARYYPRAAQTLHVRDGNFDAVDIVRRAGDPILFDDEELEETVWRFGEPIMRFGELWHAEFQIGRNPTVLSHANLVDIRIDRTTGRVERLILKTIDGREGSVVADIVVLACGGIENARLLLNAHNQLPSGVGNSNDLVGRYFMEHPHWSVPAIRFSSANWHRTWAGRGVYDDGNVYARALGLTAKVQEKQEILNARAHIFRSPDMAEDAPPRLGLFMEQAPNPASRVTLGQERDALGLRRTRLDWRLTDLDHASYRKSADKIRQAFSMQGQAVFELSSADPPEPVLLHSNHHLGTTRMSASPRHGVVDADCRMHDVPNCYVAGGSVFPTVGWANPTMTVLALTYRLARHIRIKMGKVNNT